MHRLLIRPGSVSATMAAPRGAFVRLYKTKASPSTEATGRAIRGRAPAICKIGTNNRAPVARSKHTGKDGHIHRRRHDVHHTPKSPSHGATNASIETASSEASASEATLLEAEAAASSAAEGAAASGELPPTAQQLLSHALRAAVPMIGFGFMDNTIMIHAGHYVDCTLGVTFGLSTLAAAGIGQIFSGVGGVVFGDALDAAFRKISGSTKMSSAQQAMRAARMAKMTGGVLGVALGCVLGLVNLIFVDEQKVSLLKLQALEEGQEFLFEVEVDNEIHPGYTTVKVRGPDVDGVLASITAAIAGIGCSVVELHASNRDQVGEYAGNASSTDSEDTESFLDHLLQSSRVLEDVFLIRDRSTHAAIDNEDLDDLARTVLAAAKDPLNSHSLKAQNDELQVENIALADRVDILERMLEDRQIKIRERATSADGDEKSEETAVGATTARA